MLRRPRAPSRLAAMATLAVAAILCYSTPVHGHAGSRLLPAQREYSFLNSYRSSRGGGNDGLLRRRRRMGKSSKGRNGSGNGSKMSKSKSKGANSSSDDTTPGPSAPTTPAPTVATPGPTTAVPTTAGATPVPTSPVPTVTTPNPTTATSGTTPAPTTATPTGATPVSPAPTVTTPGSPNPTVTTPATPNPTVTTPGSPAPTPLPTPAATTPAPTITRATTLAPTPTNAPAPTISTLECTDNPQDVTVNVDLQIEFVDDFFAACTEDEENTILTTIRDAMSTNFDTVTGWDGDAVFGDFAFDDNQEVNNVEIFRKLLDLPLQRNLQTGTCSASRQELLGDCTADYCRFGCVTVATTNCGTSSFTNWVDLDANIKTDMENLQYDCLGTPNAIGVDVIVNDPTARAFTNARSGEDLAKEEVDPTGGSGEDETGPAPEPAPAPEVPFSGTRASVDRPETGRTATRSNNNPTPSPACNDNAVIYNVALDIQVDFGSSSSSSCNNGQWNQIKGRVTAILNEKFPAVASWNGDVGFGSLAVDDNQEINRRRMLQQRRLPSNNICPVTRDIPCNLDVCYWTCLIAPTTSCGVNSVTNWALLSDEVQTVLAGLTYSCLGEDANLVVNLVVEEPESTGATARSGSSTGASSSSGASRAPPKEGTAERNAETTDYLSVHAKMTITFFASKGQLPDTTAINEAEDEIATFFSAWLKRPSNFGSSFQEFYMDKIVPDYNFAKPDEFILTFQTTIAVDKDSGYTSRNAASVMAAAPYRDLINKYIRQMGGQFDDTFKIHFRGSSPAHGRV